MRVKGRVKQNRRNGKPRIESLEVNILAVNMPTFIDEALAAANFVRKYGVDIYAPRSKYNDKGAPAFLLRDLNRFREIIPDYNNIYDYCIHADVTDEYGECNEDGIAKYAVYEFRKTSHGMFFLYVVRDDSPEFETLCAGIDKYQEEFTNLRIDKRIKDWLIHLNRGECRSLTFDAHGHSYKFCAARRDNGKIDGYLYSDKACRYFNGDSGVNAEIRIARWCKNIIDKEGEKYAGGNF